MVSLLQRHVDVHAGHAVEERSVGRVGDDADDQEPLGRNGRRRPRRVTLLDHIPADGVLAREESPRGARADDRDRLTRGAIAGGEVAARHHRHLHRGEITGLDDVPVGRDQLPGVGVAGGAHQRQAHALEAAGQPRCDRRALDARQPPDALDDVTREERRRDVGVPGGYQIDCGDLDAGRVEARVSRRHVLERAHEQPGDDHEHDAERYLRDQERVTQRRLPRWSAIVSQAGDAVGPGGLQCRHEAAGEGRGERHRGRERNRPAIEREPDLDRERQRRQRRDDERRHRPRQQQPRSLADRE